MPEAHRLARTGHKTLSSEGKLLSLATLQSIRKMKMKKSIVKLKMTTTNPLYLPCVEPFPGTIQPLSHSRVTSLLHSRPPRDLVVLSWQFRINFSRDKALHLTVGLPKSSCVCGYGWLPCTVYIFISSPQSFSGRLVTYYNFFINVVYTCMSVYPDLDHLRIYQT